MPRLRSLVLMGWLGALAACADNPAAMMSADGGSAAGADLAGLGASGDLAGVAPSGDLAGVAPSGDLAGVAPSGDLAGVSPSADLAGSDLAPIVTVNPPSGVWTSSGGATFATGAGGHASFSIGGQSVFGTAPSSGATVTFGYLSSETY